MRRNCLYFFLTSMMLVAVAAGPCNCTCGSFSSEISSHCDSAASCASACQTSYSAFGCARNNTVGCCGTACANYTEPYCRCLCRGNVIAPALKCSSAAKCAHSCASVFSECGDVNQNTCCNGTCVSYNPPETCTCYCGTSTYYTSVYCGSGISCASMCTSYYGDCYHSNTYGCCGASCGSFSSLSTGSTCNCFCSIANLTIPYSVGNTSLSSCTTSSCQSYCQRTYPSSCGRYINNAFCLGEVGTGAVGGTTNSPRSEAMVSLQIIAVYSTVASLAALAVFDKNY